MTLGFRAFSFRNAKSQRTIGMPQFVGSIILIVFPTTIRPSISSVRHFRMTKTDTTRTLVVGMMQTTPFTHMFDVLRRVYSTQGLCPSLLVPTGGNQEIKVLIEL